MHDYVRVIVLAVVQGIAEFLPISSKGHLVIVNELLREGKSVEGEAMSLIIVLHIGTLFSILVVYFNRLKQIVMEADWRLCLSIVIASIPAAVVGIFFKKKLEAIFEDSLYAGIGLLVTAALLIVSKWVAIGQFTDRKLPWPIALIVGCFQAMALFPGISRSGTTITGGLFAGMHREAAATFSFLIALPAVAGAVLLDSIKMFRHPETQLSIPIGALLLGTVISFVVGVVSLRLLIKMISNQKLYFFGYYCLAVGAAVIAWKLSAH